MEKPVTTIEQRKQQARAWFEHLRDEICLALEKLEADAPAALYPGEAGRFVRGPAVLGSALGVIGLAGWALGLYNA